MKYERIKNLREDCDETQQGLADFWGLARSSYSNYENGIRAFPIKALSAVADLYQTGVNYLIGRTDERKPYPRKF